MPEKAEEKKVLLTFDYELFLGAKSGTVNKCLIEPTEQIIACLEKWNSKAIFFVDTVYLVRLKAIVGKYEKAKKDFDTISQQIQKLVKKNHYVFAHIHPHWIDAQYYVRNNQWELLDTSKYRFNSISESEKSELFNRSMDILNEIISPVSPNYKLDGYRAGGWCIQPFSDFKPHFEKHGIKYDFSVLRGEKLLSDLQYYDFTNASSENIYPFKNDVLKKEQGDFVEFSISLIKTSGIYNFINRVLLKVLWKLNIKSIGDGIGAQRSVENTEKSNKEKASFELLTWIKLPLYLGYIRENNYFHIISHPKMLSGHNIRCMEGFLEKIHSRYIIETDFRKML